MSSDFKKRCLRKLVADKKPEFLLLQESKLEVVDRFIMQRIWFDADFEFAVVQAEGASGGAITIWKNNVFKFEEVISRKKFILIRGNISGNFPCVILNVYAPNNYIERRDVWNEIKARKIRFNMPWVLGGDFNEIKSTGERSGCSRVDRGIRDFQEFINCMEVIDLPMVGRKFTWSNVQEENIQSRIDRFLVPQERLDKFSVFQWGLPRITSNHCPIMLSDASKDWGPKPFRFINAWFSNPKCEQIIKEVWENGSCYRWAGVRIMQKLREVKEKVKIWNSSDFCNIVTKMDDLKKKLHQFGLLAEQRCLNGGEMVLTNRFKKVVPSLVGETQAAFLGERQILDGILIANEVIDSWKKSGSLVVAEDGFLG
ncbi:uncharacterized protein LOC131323689 [Rhododendron vialii]|uniref:uncharacterized protein LOC131323689 n=1 Tax=Rhododendron vialii TaxID=182163 RepID=UPI00265D6300|nr:uncharacterized protein LOC131323689 [Rhododendron vialii]